MRGGSVRESLDLRSDNRLKGLLGKTPVLEERRQLKPGKLPKQPYAFELANGQTFAFAACGTPGKTTLITGSNFPPS